MTPRPPVSTLFPYTTLFRSDLFPAAGGKFPGDARRHGRPLRISAGPGDLTWNTPRSCRRASSTISISSGRRRAWGRSEEHTSELQSQFHLVCRLLLEKKNQK